MRKTVTEFSVLIASPGDLLATRPLVRDAIYAWNETQGEQRGVKLAPRMWESHATPVLNERPQAVINDQVVDTADIAIAMFWSRMGTPTGEADSGTAEEIERMIGLGRRVSLYFCEASLPPDVDTAQLDKVRAYRKQWEAKGLVGTYKDETHLRELLLRHLSHHVDALTREPEESQGAAPAAPLSPGDDGLGTAVVLAARPDEPSSAFDLAKAGQLDEALAQVADEHVEGEWYGSPVEHQGYVLFYAFGQAGSRDAFRRLEGLAREYVDVATVQVLYAEALERLERGDDAFAIFERLAAAHDTARLDVWSIRSAARALARRGRLTEALRLIGRRAEQETGPKTRAALVRVAADLYEELPEHKDPVLRAALLEYALTVFGPDVDLRASLAWDYSENEAPAASLFHYEATLEREPTRASAHNNAGVVAHNLGLTSTSISHYRKAQALGESLPMSNLGNRLVNEGFLEEAEALVAAARATSDVHPNVERLAARIANLREEEVAKRATLKGEFDRITGVRVRFARAMLGAPLAQGEVTGTYTGAPAEVDVAADEQGIVSGTFRRWPGHAATFRGVLRGRAAAVSWQDPPPPEDSRPTTALSSLLMATPSVARGHGLLVFDGLRIVGYTAFGNDKLDATALEKVVEWDVRRRP